MEVIGWMKVATYEAIKRQEGKRQSQVFWILHVDMDKGEASTF